MDGSKALFTAIGQLVGEGESQDGPLGFQTVAIPQLFRIREERESGSKHLLKVALRLGGLRLFLDQQRLFVGQISHTRLVRCDERVIAG
ncbi:MAG: hypothetical protein AAGH57_04340 [Pseudomonadota bacterium]